MDKLLSVGQVAKRLGVSVDVVRSWDEQGVLKSRRTPGGHRRYLPADVDRLKNRQRAGRSRTGHSARKPLARRPAPSIHERRSAEPDYDDFDVEEDVPDIEELEAEAEREAAKERAAAEAQTRAVAADEESQRLEGLKQYGREVARWALLPTDWLARVVEDLEEFVTPKRLPSSLPSWQAQQIVRSRVDGFITQHRDAENVRRKKEDDQRKIDWLITWGNNYAVSETTFGWDSSEQGRARREVDSELKQKVKADMSTDHVKDLVDEILTRWEDDTGDDGDDDDYDDYEDEDDEEDAKEEDDSEW